MADLNLDTALDLFDQVDEEQKQERRISVEDAQSAVDAGIEDLDRQRTQRSLFEGVQENPDAYVADRDTAIRAGLPVGAVRQDRQLVESNIKLQDALNAVDEAPKTRAFLQNPENARIAHDDAKNLSDLEKAWDWYTGVWAGMGRSFLGGIDLLQMSSYATVEAFGEAVDSRDITEWGREGRIDNMAERDFYGQRMGFTEISGGTDFVEWLTSTLAEQLPMMAPTLAGASTGAAIGSGFGGVGAIPGSVIGGLLGAFIPSYVLGVGEVQSSIKEKDPDAVAPGVAFGAGIPVAALDTMIPGKLGSRVSKAFGFDPADAAADVLVDQVSKTVAKRVASISAKTLKDSGGEAVTEAIQEGLQEVAASYAVGQDVDTEQLANAMVEGFAAGLFMGGTFGGATATMEDVVTTTRAQAHREHMLGVMEQAKASVLRGRDPVVFEQYMDSLAAEADRGTVEIAPEPLVELLQSNGQDPAALFQEMGVSKDKLAKALEEGQDVSVTAGKFFSVMADHEYRDDVLLNVRGSSDSATMAEATQFQEEVKQKAEQLRKDYEATTEEDPMREVQQRVQDNAKDIRDNLTKQVQNLQHIATKRQAETNAVLYESLYTVAADEAIKRDGANADVSIEALMPELKQLGFRSVRFSDRNRMVTPTSEMDMEQAETGALNRDVYDEGFVPFLAPMGEVPHIGEEVDASENTVGRAKRYDSPQGSTRYVLEEDGRPVAMMQVMDSDAADPVIANVYVEPDYRRQGLATELFEQARGDFENLQYSRDMTESGEAFAKNIGLFQGGQFFSQAQRVVAEKGQPKATADQWSKLLSPDNGVKPHEREWIVGLEEFLADARANKETITREDMLAFIRQNGIKLDEVVRGDGSGMYDLVLNDEETEYAGGEEIFDVVSKTDKDRVFFTGDRDAAEQFMREGHTGDNDAKFTSYTMPGGENQREFYLTLPKPKATLAAVENKLAQLEEGLGDLDAEEREHTEEMIARTKEIRDELKAKGGQANATVKDWLVPPGHRIGDVEADNRLVVRLRVNDRTGPNGERILFVEEMQGDRQQEARKDGYGDGVPMIPFSDTNKWTELALKRVILQAVNEGYDSVAWTPGEVQAERYSLAQAVSWIDVRRGVDGTASIMIMDKDDTVITEVATDADGKVTKGQGEGETLDRVIGKEMAEKILTSPVPAPEGFVVRNTKSGNISERFDTEEDAAKKLETYPEKMRKDLTVSPISEDKPTRTVIEGEDLKVGGEGMKGFYDKTVVNLANKLGKKYGAKVEVTQIGGQAPATDEDVALLDELGVKGTGAETADVWSLPITDKMRDAVQEQGLPLFQGEQDPYGRIANLPDGRILIDAFEKADMSTILHESGHLFVRIVERLATADGASPRFQEIYQTFLEYTEAESAADLDIRTGGEAARAKQEKLAEAFEAYLMEGKAPSTKLHEAFLMYKNWLLKVYDGIRRALGVRLNDDIRKAFDKMLATDAEIEAMAAVHNFNADQNASVIAVMTEGERTAWDTLTDLANDASANAKMAREAAAQARAEADWWRKELKDRSAAILERLYELPEYQAFWYLTRGVMRGEPTVIPDLRIDRSILEDMGIDLKTLPKSKRAVYTSDPETAADPDFIAQMFGFDSGIDLINALTDLPNAETVAREQAEGEMKIEHGDMADPDDVKALMEESAYNAERAAAINLELDALARKTGQDKIAKPVIKAAVAKMLDEINIRDILNPQKHLTASIRAAKASERAAGKRDWQKAFTEKRKHLLNHELYRETLKAKEEVEKGARYMLKFSQRKKNFKGIDAAYVDRIKEITSVYGLGAEMSMARRIRLEKEAFLSFMEEAQVYDGAVFTFPREVLDADEKTHYRDISLMDFRALRDTVKNIEAQGRLKKEGINNEERFRINTLAARAVDNVQGMSDTHASKVLAKQQSLGVVDEALNAVKYADAGLTKTEFLIEMLDGGRQDAWFEAVYKPFVDAEYQENTLIRANSERFHKAFDALPVKVKKLLNKNEFINELGRKMTRSELIALALNVGNESNLKKVIKGSEADPSGKPAMSEKTIMEALNKRLTKQEWDFVQEVWDIFEDMYPAVEAVFRKENGRSPEQIDAKSIETPHGTYRGGYFPMIYDPATKMGAAIENMSALEQLQSQEVQATVFSGMTKERSESFASPVLFDLTRVAGELTKSAHFISHYDAVRAVKKFLAHDDVRNAVVEKLGQDYYEMLDSWVGQVATGGRAARMKFRIVDDIVESMRNNVTVATMGSFVGGSITTLLSQPLGLFTSMDALARGVDAGTDAYRPDLGPLRLMGGLMQMLNPEAVTQAWRASKELRFRLDNADRDIRAINTMLRGVQGKKAVIQRAMLIGIPALQLVAVDMPTWIAAYNMALKKNLSEEAAVDFADGLVRKSQGSGSVKDLSPLLATRGAARGLTMFMTFFNTLYNIQTRLAREAHMDAKTLNKAVFGALFLWILPSFFEMLFRQQVPDDNDEQSVLEMLAIKSVMMPLSTIPLVRDVASATESGYRYAASPIEGPVANGVKAASDMMDPNKDLGYPTTRAAISALGLTGYVPSTVINRVLRTMENIDKGEDWGYWDFFVGPPPKKK